MDGDMMYWYKIAVCYNGGGPNNEVKVAEDSSYVRKGNQLSESLGAVGETS